MPYFDFFWTDENLDHIADHGVAPEEFEQIVKSPQDVDTSNSCGEPCAFGYTHDGRYLICIYEHLDALTVLPITAYEIDD